MRAWEHRQQHDGLWAPSQFKASPLEILLDWSCLFYRQSFPKLYSSLRMLCCGSLTCQTFDFLSYRFCCLFPRQLKKTSYQRCRPGSKAFQSAILEACQFFCLPYTLLCIFWQPLGRFQCLLLQNEIRRQCGLRLRSCHSGVLCNAKHHRYLCIRLGRLSKRPSDVDPSV